jgi:hypothetical protein
VQKDDVLEDENDDWIPVAYCATDESRNAALVELPEGYSPTISRLWVPLKDIKFGNTHAFSHPEGTVYAVVQVNLLSLLTAWEDRVGVVTLVKTAEAAQLECDRLNSRTGGEGAILFWQPVKGLN